MKTKYSIIIAGGVLFVAASIALADQAADHYASARPECKCAMQRAWPEQLEGQSGA